MFKIHSTRNRFAKPDNQQNSRIVGPGNSHKPILVLLHEVTTSAGAVGQWLQKHGYKLDIRLPIDGDRLPQTLAAHGGVIVFGGTMSVNDEIEQINREIKWFDLVLRTEIPFLGICLGAQMMGRALGAKVEARRDGQVEIGYTPLLPTVRGKALVPHWPQKMFMWHKEGFSLPSGAQCLTKGDLFAAQAFSYGRNVFAVQFHPEITKDIILRWLDSAGYMLEEKGAHDQARLLADHAIHVKAQRLWMEQFMSHWTSLMARQDIG